MGARLDRSHRHGTAEPARCYPGMTFIIGRTLAAALMASVLLAACAHTTAKVNTSGSERGYSSNGEVGVGLPF